MLCSQFRQRIEVQTISLVNNYLYYSVYLCLAHSKYKYSLDYFSNAPRSLKDRWMQPADKHTLTDMCACLCTWKSPCNSCNILLRTAIPHNLRDDARTQSSENGNLPVVVVVIVTCMHTHTRTPMHSLAHV